MDSLALAAAGAEILELLGVGKWRAGCAAQHVVVEKNPEALFEIFDVAHAHSNQKLFW